MRGCSISWTEIDRLASDRFGLFVGRAPTLEMSPLRYIEERSASAVYWLDGGAAYALAGPVSRDKLMRIAHVLAEELAPPTGP